MQNTKLRLLEALINPNKLNTRANSSKNIISKYLILEKPNKALEVIY